MQIIRVNSHHRAQCDNAEDLPSDERIHHLVRPGQHLVLEWSGLPRSAKSELVDSLQNRFPEYRVFDSGAFKDGLECITILHVMPREVVLEHASQLVVAAHNFRVLANTMMAELASHFHIPVARFSEAYTERKLYQTHSSGNFVKHWSYFFHGHECRLKDKNEGIVLEVILGFEPEFGVLDPGFFIEFLSTTSRWESLRKLFPSGFNDAYHAFGILETEGLLKRIPDNSQHRTGLIATQ